MQRGALLQIFTKVWLVAAKKAFHVCPEFLFEKMQLDLYCRGK